MAQAKTLLSYKNTKFAFSHSWHSLSWWNFKSYATSNILHWNFIYWANTSHGHTHRSTPHMDTHRGSADHEWTQTQTQTLILPKILLKQARAVEITFLQNTFSASLGKQTLKQEQSPSPTVLPHQYWKLPELFPRKKITMPLLHATYLTRNKNTEEKLRITLSNNRMGNELRLGRGVTTCKHRQHVCIQV